MISSSGLGFRTCQSLNPEQPVATTPGLNTVFWRTWDEQPGTYKVALKNGKKEIIKYAVLKPRIVYPVMNYRDKE